MNTSAQRRIMARTAPLAGLRIVTSLGVRREWRPIACWGAVIVAVVVSSVGAIASLYPDTASRERLAGTIGNNPAFLALNGPLPATSIGGVAAWRIGVYGAAAVAYLGASTVVRRTRAEEESGRAELLASAVLGRFTLLITAVAMAWGACLLIGVVCALGCMAQGLPVGGSLAFGVGLAGPGVVFTALAAVTAQIFQSSRAALSTAGLALGLSYGTRAIADSSSSVRWVSLLSPLGWSQRLAPYGDSHWWVVLLFLGAAAGLTAAALRLQTVRDVGSGLFRARPGPPGSSRLRSGITLAARLHRSRVRGWVVGLAVFGALTGSLAASSGGLLADNARVEQIVQQVGGVGAPSDELFAVMAGIAGVLAAAFVVAAALQVRTEETAGRAELSLSTSLSRRGLLGGHLLVSYGGAAVLLLVAGIAAGLSFGSRSGSVATALGTGVSAMSVQLPPALLMGGLAFALVGWLPRQSPVAWVLLAAFVLLGQLGLALGLPQGVVDLSPFAHVPPLPTGSFTAWPLVALLLLAAAASGAGFIGFSRRDIG